MLKKFLIVDSTGLEFGTLSYESGARTWHVEIDQQRTWEDTPLSLALYIRHGIYSLDEHQSLSWVRDRLLPPNRQNIHDILHALDLPEYDEYGLLQVTAGRSPNDDLFLVEQDS